MESYIWHFNLLQQLKEGTVWLASSRLFIVFMKLQQKNQKKNSKQTKISVILYCFLWCCGSCKLSTACSPLQEYMKDNTQGHYSSKYIIENKSLGRQDWLCRNHSYGRNNVYGLRFSELWCGLWRYF